MLRAEKAEFKARSNSLKITLNGTFGKLGSVFSAFYSPDLMLAVTLTGQLNLMCLIAELEKLPDVRVMSANTDGIMVDHPESQRQHVLDVVVANAARTGFEYEETPYRTIAMKDVNNYIAITDEVEYAEVIGGTGIKVGKSKGGVAKRKGLYAETSLMKNPTMPVCSEMAVRWLMDGAHPQKSIRDYKDIKDFVAIRNVKGGGVQHLRTVEVDDWELIEDLGTKDNKWFSKRLDRAVLRKSRPKPVEVFEGGQSFGRVARWFMTTESLPPICYAESGNKVPKTEGARVCMTLPDGLPADLDRGWYIAEAIRILEDLGVNVEEEELV